MNIEKSKSHNISFNSMKLIIEDMFVLHNKSSKIAIIIDRNEKLTYQELYQKVRYVILQLEKLQLDKNICIGLRFDNQLIHLVFSFALFILEIKHTFISPFEVANIQKKDIDEIGVDILIQNRSVNNKNSNLIYVDDELNFHNFVNILKVSNKLKKSTLIALLGSGTTGKPKLIELETKVYATQVKNDMNTCDYDEKEIFYSYSPTHYQFTMRRIIIALIKGLSVILPIKRPENLIQFSLFYKINHLTLTGDQTLNILLKNMDENKNNYLPDIKSITLSSSLIPDSIRKKILNLISKNICISYGTNEFGNIAEAKSDDIKNYLGTVGKVNPNINLKIVNDKGNECSFGETGNILVSTSNMLKEYSNNLEATKKSFTKDGYYPGDIGYLTKDGQLIIQGRSDDMMIFAGCNIYPRELEDVLNSHPHVIESAVFPMTINEQSGIPYAIVVLSRPTSEKVLNEYCYNLLGWKRPRRIFTIDKLPRNKAGKVLKRELIEKLTHIDYVNTNI